MFKVNSAMNPNRKYKQLRECFKQRLGENNI